MENARMQNHILLVALIRIGFGALGLLTAMIALVVIVGGGLISGDPQAIAITGLVGPFASVFLGLLPALGMIGGVGMLKRKPWARYLVLVLAILDLLNIPFGTIIGIYTLWVLLQDGTEKSFAQV